ncbi:MAG TPA: hypothetical protein VJT71_18690 [Pyrinomonadaceae bacterium]|jgi:hypothetical protein|nr:hypothetical protein [Pyrinomonadaceae bacterium]
MADTADDNASTPRRVKVFGIIALVVILLFVILLLTRSHGPGRHMRGDTSYAPSNRVTEYDVQRS